MARHAIGSGTSLFNESVLTQQGFSKSVYYDLMKFTFLIGMLTQLPVGWLGRHMKLNHLQSVGLLLLGVCLLWLPSIHSLRLIWIYAIGMGISGTMTTVLFFTIWTQAYGRKHLGQIQSVAQMLTVLASALGPKMFAECLQRTGSYALIFQSLAVLVLILAGISMFVRVPRPEEADERPETSPSLAAAGEV